MNSRRNQVRENPLLAPLVESAIALTYARRADGATARAREVEEVAVAPTASEPVDREIFVDLDAREFTHLKAFQAHSEQFRRLSVPLGLMAVVGLAAGVAFGIAMLPILAASSLGAGIPLIATLAANAPAIPMVWTVISGAVFAAVGVAQVFVEPRHDRLVRGQEWSEREAKAAARERRMIARGIGVGIGSDGVQDQRPPKPNFLARLERRDLRHETRRFTDLLGPHKDNAIVQDIVGDLPDAAAKAEALTVAYEANPDFRAAVRAEIAPYQAATFGPVQALESPAA